MTQPHTPAAANTLAHTPGDQLANPPDSKAAQGAAKAGFAGPPTPWWGAAAMAAMSRDFLGFVQQQQRTHGDLVFMQLYWEKMFIVSSPEGMRAVLVDNASKLIRQERSVEVFAEVQGQHSVMVTEGAPWQRLHRLLMPGFAPRKVAGYAGLMVAAARHALDAAVPAQPGASQLVNVDALAGEVTMEVILRTLFSSPVGDEAWAVSRAVQTLNQVAMRELVQPLTLPDWLPLPGKAAKRQALAMLNGLIDGHIRARKQLDPARAPQDDLLAMLLAVRDESPEGTSAIKASPAQAQSGALTDMEVRDQCKVMFLAGHDTTATAMQWWCWLMAGNPGAAQRAREEVDRVLGQRDPTPADMPQLDWLVASLKEAMRLYPPAPSLIMRRTTADIELDGKVIPSRSLVAMSPWVVQHDPRWFPEPEAFRPERFTKDAPSLPRGAWMPFGTGPRVCIGQHFAMLEMTVVAAMLLQRYELALEPGEPKPVAQFNVTLRPTASIRLRLHRRGH
jgi:cytochrome P450